MLSYVAIHLNICSCTDRNLLYGEGNQCHSWAGMNVFLLSMVNMFISCHPIRRLYSNHPKQPVFIFPRLLAARSTRRPRQTLRLPWWSLNQENPNGISTLVCFSLFPSLYCVFILFLYYLWLSQYSFLHLPDLLLKDAWIALYSHYLCLWGWPGRSLKFHSYDFEASSAAQSAEIVTALKKQIDTYKLDHGTGAG